MTVRGKILAITFTTLLTCLFIILALVAWQFLEKSNALERQGARNMAKRAVNAIRADMDSLEALCADYAYWDDSCRFIEDQNAAYLQSNFPPTTFRKCNLQHVAIMGKDGALLHELNYDQAGKTFTASPKAMAEAMSTNHLAFKPGEPLAPRKVLLMVDGQPWLLASCPVLSSHGEEPVRGTFVFGRIVDAAYLNNIGKIILTTPILQPPDDLTPSSSQIETDGENTDADISAQIDDSGALMGFAVMRDRNGVPVVKIRVDVTRNYRNQTVNSLFILLTALVAIVLLTSCLLVLLLDRQILSRLKTLHRFVQTMHPSSKRGQRVHVGGGDELSELGASVNHLLDLMDQELDVRERAEAAVREQEETYRSLFTHLLSGFALHEIILDEAGNPVDYRFLQANPAFEQMTGLSAGQIIGRRVLEVMPNLEPFWVETYGRVALTGEAAHFEHFNQVLGRHYMVRAFVTEPGRFAVLFHDITGTKQSELMAIGMLEMSVSLNNAASIQDAGETIWNLTKHLEGIDCFGIYLFRQTSLDLVYHKGIGDGFVQTCSRYSLGEARSTVILQGRPVYGDREAFFLSEGHIQEEGIQSLAVLPLHDDSGVFGSLNLGSHTLERIPEKHRTLLETLAAQVGGAISRAQAQESLRHRLEIDALATSISVRFLQTAAGQIPRAIQDSLQDLGCFLGASGILFCLVDSQQATIETMIEWSSAPGEIRLDQLEHFHIGQFPWLVEQLRNAQIIRACSMGDIPLHAESERRLWGRLDIQTGVIIPLFLENLWQGAIVLFARDIRPGWLAADLSVLRIAGDLMISAWRRAKTEQDQHERILALTQPLGDISFLRFEDIFNLEDIQSLQDAFANATGVASIITDPTGKPITRPSNFCRFCSELVRGTEQGLANCMHSDAILGQSSDHYLMQPCLSGGLYDGGTGIHAGDHHVANWLIGQVIDDAIDPAGIVGYAVGLGVDEEQAWAAAKEIKRMSRDQFERVCEMLHLFARQLSTLAVQNIQQARFIVELSQAEETQQRLFAAMEQATESVIITGVKGDIQYVNPAFVKIFGQPLPDIDGRDIMSLDFTLQEPETRASILRSITQGGSWKGCIAAKRPDGHLTHQEIVVSPVVDAVGDTCNFVIVSRDVTQQMALESQLFQAQRMEAVGQLAGGVAHDFNNLLQVIAGYTDLALSDTAPGQPCHEELLQIEQAAKRASGLTRQLLAFSRRQVMHPTLMDMNELLANMTKMLTRLIGEHIQLEFRPAPGLWSVRADQGHLEQAIMNLCVNARDAMPEGGQIIIETANAPQHPVDSSSGPMEPGKGAYIEISILDTGHGMSPEVMEHAFEPFFSTKEVGKGTGLGLATVYGIIKQHEGIIQVYSEQGRGTRFNIYLPALGDDLQIIEKETSAERKEKLDAPLNTGPLLLAEDDALVREMVVQILHKAGYAVLIAKDGQEAMHLFDAESDKIALVLLDVVMPKASGRQVYDHIRQTGHTTPVIFCSGYSLTVLDTTLLPPEDRILLQKPYEPMRLLEIIHDTLRSATQHTPDAS